MTKTTCTVPGCGRKHVARGLCTGHYNRWQKQGEAFDRSPIKILQPAGTLCSIDGCERVIYGKGLCNPHWQRQHLQGSTGDKPLVFRSQHGLTLRQRFDIYGQATPTSRGCIEWTGPADRKGYGIIHFEGENRIASRVAWELSYGEIPEGKVIRHKCDNPPCVNPEHLTTGTQWENLQDMVSRDRHARGERGASAKVNAEDVLAMREQAAAGVFHREIAERYGLSRRHVGDIINRVCWKHI